MISKDRIYENLERLVAVPSVSGTVNEDLGAVKLEEMLYEIPYFAEHRENVKLVPLENDVLGRRIVTAYLECCPESKKVVLLVGHYDVVDVEEFGHLKKEAYDIEIITRRINELPMDEETRKDYESGEWYFGRGTADMKIGHALSLELLRHYSEEGGINGNLLYVGVCGEETNSEGMLRAVPFFNQFKEEKGVEYEALLMPECYMVENQATDPNHYIHYGSQGKLMPMFFFVGSATHAEEPFLGIDPLLLSNEVYKRMQLNPDFVESVGADVGVSPVALKSMDLKTTYSCSTPLYAAAYYTLSTLCLDPKETVKKLTDIAEESFREAINFVDMREKAYIEKTGIHPAKLNCEPCIKTFDQLYKEAKEAYDGDFDECIKELIKEEMKPGVEMQDVTIKIVKKTYETAPAKQPMIIISFIPPYYPDVMPDKTEERAARLLEAVEDIIEFAKNEFGESLKTKDYYGVSDLAFTALDESKDYDYLFSNIVGANQMWTLPTEDMKKFSVPGIVLGCYGKDLHKHTERLHKKYNFEVIPVLYERIINKLLG